MEVADTVFPISRRYTVIRIVVMLKLSLLMLIIRLETSIKQGRTGVLLLCMRKLGDIGAHA